jgi:hypothetical protein
MSNELRELVKAQRNFHRDGYRHGSNALLILLVIILALSLSIIFFYMVRPLPDFYASSSNGSLALLTPMSTPNYSHTPLIK